MTNKVIIEQYLDTRNNTVHHVFRERYPKSGEDILCEYNKSIRVVEVNLKNLTVEKLL